jgi:hypothetical protein
MKVCMDRLGTSDGASALSLGGNPAKFIKRRELKG